MADLDGSDHVRDEYEVEGSYHFHRTESGERVRLEPGDRFHPTRKQVAQGSLAGKARKVSESSGPTSVSGADIGLRSLDMTDAALELALDAGLEVSDFEAVEPAGAHGDYLKSQVEELV